MKIKYYKMSCTYCNESFEYCVNLYSCETLPFCRFDGYPLKLDKTWIDMNGTQRLERMSIEEILERSNKL